MSNVVYFWAEKLKREIKLQRDYGLPVDDGLLMIYGALTLPEADVALVRVS